MNNSDYEEPPPFPFPSPDVLRGLFQTFTKRPLGPDGKLLPRKFSDDSVNPYANDTLREVQIQEAAVPLYAALVRLEKASAHVLLVTSSTDVELKAAVEDAQAAIRIALEGT